MLVALSTGGMVTGAETRPPQLENSLQAAE